jgi:hypothetical protein
MVWTGPGETSARLTGPTPAPGSPAAADFSCSVIMSPGGMEKVVGAFGSGESVRLAG